MSDQEEIYTEKMEENMIAFEVSVNDKLIKTVSAEEFMSLNVLMNVTFEDGKLKPWLVSDMFFENNEDNPVWIDRKDLAINDEVTVKLVDTDAVDDYEYLPEIMQPPTIYEMSDTKLIDERDSTKYLIDIMMKNLLEQQKELVAIQEIIQKKKGDLSYPNIEEGLGKRLHSFAQLYNDFIHDSERKNLGI